MTTDNRIDDTERLYIMPEHEKFTLQENGIITIGTDT